MENLNRGVWKKEFLPLGIFYSEGKSIRRYLVTDKEGRLDMMPVGEDIKLEYKPKMALSLVKRNFPLVINYGGGEFTFSTNGDELILNITRPIDETTDAPAPKKGRGK